jgi:23S rRNA (uracil1939-C5)-methyltransferase
MTAAPRRRSEVELTVDRVGALGDGIADLDGTPVYVPAAAPGDRVRIRLGDKRGDGIAGDPVELLAPGPGRVEPPCPHFGACGGCLVQHLRADVYTDWKRGLLRQALDRRGLHDMAVAPTITTPEQSRRRAVLAARRGRRGLFLGFNEHRSNRIVDVAGCRVLRPEITALLPALREALAPLTAEREALDVAVTLLDDGLDIVVAAAQEPGLSAREALAAAAARLDLARLSWRTGGDPAEPLAHRRRGVIRFGSVTVRLPPGGFLQASAEGEAALVGLVRAGIDGAGRVVDLFSGAGTFAFPLADSSRVQAVDADRDAIAALTLAAREAGLAGRVGGAVRDLYRDPLAAAELARAEAVVFDPPRSGGRAQVAEIAASGVPTVVAVSCNPATFGRDARVLVDAGYRPGPVAPVDQFLWSPHLELVCVFRR